MARGRLEPWGMEREDWRAAAIMAAHAGCDSTIRDLLPPSLAVEPEVQGMSDDELQASMQAFCESVKKNACRIET